MNRRDRCLRIGWATVVVAALAVLPLAAHAGVTYSETKGDHPVTTIHMAVTPAAEPVPALGKRLVAREIDLEPGNAAPYYYRAMLEVPRTMEAVRKEFGEEFDRWDATGNDAVPIDKLPLEKVRKAAARAFRPSIESALGTATMRSTCEWDLGVRQLRGPQMFEFVLPECQITRELSRMLSLRARLAIAEGRYDDALDAMRMNYRLGRDVARVPIIVCSLVGIAEAGIANGTVTELVAAPGSPNLYWALAELPQPPVDMREAIRAEMGVGLRIFPFLEHAETTNHTPEEWDRLLVQSLADLTQLSDHGLSQFGAGVTATGLALLGYPYAKQQLIDEGLAPERVKAMAVGQVIAVYTARNLQRLTDDFEKLWYMPFWEMRKRAAAAEEELHAASPLEGGPHREVLPVATMLLPAINAARAAEVRLERDIAALQVIEALRMYAARHEGALPAKLADVHEVPVPINPATGQPFEYHLDGQTAVLELPESDGVRNYARRYEITIAQHPEQ